MNLKEMLRQITVEDENRLTWKQLKSGRWTGTFEGRKVGSITAPRPATEDRPAVKSRAWTVTTGDRTLSGRAETLQDAIREAGQAFRVHRGLT